MIESEELKEMIINMKHTIGFDNDLVKKGKYKCYRNLFMGEDKYLDKAVELDLAVKKEINSEMWCDSYCYYITDKGVEFLSDITNIKITKGD